MFCSFRVLPVSTSGPQLDVQGGNSQLLAPLSHILSRQHSSIRGGLVSVGLHLHPTSNTADCFSEDQKEGKLIQKMITRIQWQNSPEKILFTQKQKDNLNLWLFPSKKILGTIYNEMEKKKCLYMLHGMYHFIRNHIIGLYEMKPKI